MYDGSEQHVRSPLRRYDLHSECTITIWEGSEGFRRFRKVQKGPETFQELQDLSESFRSALKAFRIVQIHMYDLHSGCTISTQDVRSPLGRVQKGSGGSGRFRRVQEGSE